MSGAGKWFNDRARTSETLIFSFGPPASSSVAAVRHGLDLDERVVAARVVAEVAFVDAEEEPPVARGVELSARADGDEVVVVVADDGDEFAGRLVAHQLLGVNKARQSRRRREIPVAERDAARGGDAQALALPDHQARIRPAVGRAVGAHADADGEEGRAGADPRRRGLRRVGRRTRAVVCAARVRGRAGVAVTEDGRAGGLPRPGLPGL